MNAISLAKEISFIWPKYDFLVNIFFAWSPFQRNETVKLQLLTGRWIRGAYSLTILYHFIEPHDNLTVVSLDVVTDKMFIP